MYQVTKPLVHTGTQTVLLCSHIPKQSELDNFLPNLRTKVLLTMNLPIQTAQLVSAYAKSPKFKILYEYIKNWLC